MSQLSPITASFIAANQTQIIRPQKKSPPPRSAQELRNDTDADIDVPEQVASSDIVESVDERPANHEENKRKRGHQSDNEDQSNDDSSHRLDITA